MGNDMNESQLYQSLKRGLSQVGHVSRIETLVTSGIPDVSLAAFGGEAWLELKIERSGKLSFEPTQLVWWPKRARAGGLVRIVYVDAGEQTVKVVDHSEVIAAPKTYNRGLVMVQSSYLRPIEWKRRPSLDWPSLAAYLVAKVP